MKTIRWGILGAGRIAGVFAKSLAHVEGAELTAIGSRSQEKADAFAQAHAIPRRYADYGALAEDPDINIVYIATPHPMHAENIELCLRAGKAVLCEKPFTLNAAQAARVIRLAHEKRLFLMEAMWSRFLPALVKVRQLLSLGAIGEPRILSANFGFRATFDPTSRLFNPELGGGALLDVGVYVLSLASMIFGTPASIHGSAHLGKSGVDEQSAYLLGYPNGAFASLFSTVATDSSREADIYGEKGSLHLPSPWYAAKQVIFKRPEKPDEVFDCPYEGSGFQFEAQEVMRCLQKGSTESHIMPLDETLAIVETMDALRTQWGLRYPGEE